MTTTFTAADSGFDVWGLEPNPGGDKAYQMDVRYVDPPTIAQDAAAP